jgi:hypothetical protein
VMADKISVSLPKQDTSLLLVTNTVGEPPTVPTLHHHMEISKNKVAPRLPWAFVVAEADIVRSEDL